MPSFRVLLHCLLCLCLLFAAAGSGSALAMAGGGDVGATAPDPGMATGDCHEAGARQTEQAPPTDTAHCADPGDCTQQKACDCACQHLLAAMVQQRWVADSRAPDGQWRPAGSLSRHGPLPARLSRPPIG